VDNGDTSDTEDDTSDEEEMPEHIAKARNYVPWRSPSLARRVVENVKNSPCLVRKVLQNQRSKHLSKKGKEIEIFSLALAVAHHSGQARNPYLQDKVDAWTSMGEDMSAYLEDYSDYEDDDDTEHEDDEKDITFKYKSDAYNSIQDFGSPSDCEY